ncbi:hypothetical protein E1176_00350 [Fulvivirga sp. RKSG066]|nr:hypothetical protein [Fulvivirga aurantia]
MLSAVICIGLLSASTCYGPDPHRERARYGLKPNYVNDIGDMVQQLPPQPLINPGKIYVYGNQLLISEQFKGVHVFDNSDPAAPRKLYFLAITGNVDVAIKNNVLYGDQFNNLVSVDLSSIGSDSLEVSRLDRVLEGIAFYDLEEYEPPQNDVFYECADPSFGKVQSWEWDSVYYPCYK